MPRCKAATESGHRVVDPGESTTGFRAGGLSIRESSGPAPAAARRHGELTLAAIYARVSTDKQEKEETVESQLDALRRAAEERGLEPAPEFIFVDEGYSGARMDRPALDRLRDLAREGAFDTLLVYCPDRLARQYAYQVVVLEELKAAGCEVIFVKHPFGESPEERMLLQIQGVFAEYERALIQERTRRGRIYAAKQGRVNWGHAPYGYDLVPKTDSTPQQLRVDEAEADIVREIFRWCVEEELSTGAIERRLNARSVPTNRKSTRGWHKSSLIDLLRNSVYKGEAYYNKKMRSDAKVPRGGRSFKDLRPGNNRGWTRRPKEEWISVKVPAIVDPETWELAQKQLDKNRALSPRNNKRRAYLLRALLVCGRCGRRMVGNWRGSRGYYICAARYPKSAPWACQGRTLSVAKSEPWIWGHVKRLLSDPQLLKGHYREGLSDPAVDTQQERERERIEKKLSASDREVRRLLDAYQNGIIELDELRERRGNIREHSRLLRDRLGEIQARRTDREQELRLLEGLETFCDGIRGALDEPAFDLKQRILRLVIDRIIVEDARVVIRHIIPIPPQGSVSIATGTAL